MKAKPVYIAPPLHKKLKLMAVRLHKSLADVVEEIIKMYFEKGE